MAHAPYKTTERQRKYRFPNGYGASVVRDQYTYGGDRGLFELAVLDGEHLTYVTPITSDVIGWLTEDEVQEKLDEIAALDRTEVEHAAKRAKRRELQDQIDALQDQLDELR